MGDILLGKTIHYLSQKRRVLLLTTSNRWKGEKGEKPKSTLLAMHIKEALGEKAVLLDIPSLKIYPCEGNVSTVRGNTCGQKAALLKDKNKNPSGYHRCWASINNKDDELWKVSKELLQSDCVLFFASVRWGQANGFYQKLIERLTWLENRHSSLGEKNIIKNIDAGMILVGQNWHGKEVLATEKKVLSYFGFHVVPALCWNWQYMRNLNDESLSSYRKAFPAFEKKFLE
ncbi:NAD(P)H-dependent oxidoreductase [Candidatus Woesearchaeota archaeon]|nr:NAD(P)H-dependent oxidoreductase [Candidatus Woesearchaeota archaeon]